MRVYGIRITFLFVLGLILMSCKTQEQRPNFLFLVIEDTSPYLFPAYGNETIKTPNLDYLAENGVVFTNAFSNGPQCSPARSSLISGSYATTYGNDYHRNNHVVPQQYFWPQYLRNAGYFCVNAGKTDYNVTREVQKKYYPITWDLNSGTRTEKKNNVSYNDSLRGDKPFYAQFNNHTTHMSRMTSVKVAYREPCTISPDEVVLPPHVPDLPDVRADYALHLEGVRDADKWVGIFVDDLKERGLLDNTIIFFFSDHGGCLPRGKAFPYETGFRPALIIYAPKKYQHLLPAKPGTKSDRLVEFADFGPTLLSVAGVKPPEHLQGKAFMGKYEEKPRDYSYCFRCNTGFHFDPSRSVLDGKYQYIRYYTPYKVHALKQSFQWGMPAQLAWDSLYIAGACKPEHLQYYEAKPVEMLFDSEKDPYGMNNLASNPEYKNVLDKMREKGAEHIRETKDLGFFPLDIRTDLAKQGISLYEWVRENNYDFEEMYNAVEKASNGNAEDYDYLVGLLSNDRPEMRFWGVSGIAHLASLKLINKIPGELEVLTKDSTQSVAATAAEALVYLGEKKKGIDILLNLGKKNNLFAWSSLEELRGDVEYKLPEIREIAKNHKNGEVRFSARGILINFKELPVADIFEKKAVDGFLRNHKDRVVNWKPTLP